MDPYTQTPDPLNQAPGSIPQPEPQRSAIGPVAGVIIIVVLLIAGALYFWGISMNGTGDVPPLILGDEQTATPETGMPTSDASAGLPQQSTSDEVGSIEADLQAMDLDALRASADADVTGLAE